jgi:hypothetical protein
LENEPARPENPVSLARLPSDSGFVVEVERSDRASEVIVRVRAAASSDPDHATH